MAYRIRTENFEGPFDLLLHLVHRQRIDIGSINISQIADQYLDEIEHMRRLDLDVASDFLVVASTLLEIKAASLLPSEHDDVDDEFEDMAPSEARDILLGRLLEYKKYKNAAASLDSRFVLESRYHSRRCGIPAEFLDLYPDYLEGVTLADLAGRLVGCCTRRDVFLLDSEHIAGKTLSVETFARSLHERIRSEKRAMFSELLAKRASAPQIVATFLALLELMKRNMVEARQMRAFGDIEIRYIEGSGEFLPGDSMDDYGDA